MKKILDKYLKSKIGAMVAIVIVLLIIFLSRNVNSSSDTISVVSGDLIQKIEVTGTVRAVNKAELSFEKGGVVKDINYKVGDKINTGETIVSLDSADSSAQLQGAEASLLAEEAHLAELEKGLRPEELSVENSKLKSSETLFEDSRIGIVNAIHDSYVKVSGSVFNYTDIFFTNPQSSLPRIKVHTDSYNQESNINTSRTILGEKLLAWKGDLDKINLDSDINQYTEKVHKYLETAKTFFSQISVIISNLSTGNSGLTQTEIDSYNLTLNNALAMFTAGVNSIATAEAEYRNASSNLSLARDQFGLKEAGTSEEGLQVQRAKVAQAQANVSNYKAEFLKKKLVSPIDGVLGKIDVELGEYVSVGKVAAVVVSDLFKIEVNVPESDIAKISMGNKARVTLDAYDSSVVFSAHVVSMDLAETIVEGVPTYKVVLEFDEKDSRIRSGMTANIDIITQDKSNVILVPFRSIKDRNGEKFVQVVKDDPSDFSEVKVITGERGSDGRVEVISGVDVGTKILMVTK